MEFNQKLQKLRKDKGLTQEELAKELFVSRTAISKWESAKGYPNIDSLKEISKFFSVSIDDLLSGEEVLTIAEADNKQRQNNFTGTVFGLLDCSIVMFLFLPIFGQRTNGAVQSVSLLHLTEISLWLKMSYYILLLGTVVCGILILMLKNCDIPFLENNKRKISLALNSVTAMIFIISLQPYAAAFLFIFLVIKVLMLIKW